jgi:ABC-type transporter Mla subunit MlaD
VAYSARSIQGEDQDLNDALGNLAGFAQDGAGVLTVLDQQGTALHDLVKNTGVVFGALVQRQGALRGLIVNSNNTFETTAREQAALQQIFAVFPTFLDQSRLTAARLERFSVNTRPLVNELKPVADDLGPTVRDLGDLAPDLRTLFVKLKPVIRVSPQTLPQGARLLSGARPVLDGLHVMLPELNPILSYLNYDQTAVSHFFSNSSPALTYRINGDPSSHMLPQFGVTNGRSLQLDQNQPNWVRGNAYSSPTYQNRWIALGTAESFSCANAGGTVRKPDPTVPMPPCFVTGPTLYNGQTFPFLSRGHVVARPGAGNDSLAGHYPANAQTHP